MYGNYGKFSSKLRRKLIILPYVLSSLHNTCIQAGVEFCLECRTTGEPQSAECQAVVRGSSEWRVESGAVRQGGQDPSQCQ